MTNRPHFVHVQVRAPKGNTVFMGGVELDSTGPKRKCTGRCFLVLVKDKFDTTFQEVIRANVRPDLSNQAQP